MCSWGSPHKQGKFYKGVATDTPWNKDLLWRHHVTKETEQINSKGGPEIEGTGRHVNTQLVRKKMGISGTLIPDTTPQTRSLTSQADPPLIRQNLEDHTVRSSGKRTSRSRSSRSRSSRSSISSYSESTSSVTSSEISRMRSRIEEATKRVEEKAGNEIQELRRIIEEETTKRQEAERKLDLLCNKLGVEPSHT